MVLYCVCRSVQSSLQSPINGTIYLLAPIPIAHLLVGMFGGFQRESMRSPEMTPGPITSP